MRRQKCKATLPEFFLSIVLTITFILLPLSFYSNATFAATRGVRTSLALEDSWSGGSNSCYKYSVTVTYTRDGTISSWEATVTLPYAGTITDFWSSNNISYSLSGTTLTLKTTQSTSLSRNSPCTGIGFILSVPLPTSTPTPTVTPTPIPPTATPTPAPTVPIETTAAPTAVPTETIAPPIETTAAVTTAANTPTPSPTPKPKKTPTPKPTEATTTETIVVTEPSETTTLPSETTLATVVAVIDATQDTSATATPTPSPTPLTGVLGATITNHPTNTGKDPFNWLPLIITAFVLFLLILLIKREKDGKKTPVFSPIADQVSDSWKNKVMPAVSGLKGKKIPFMNQAKAASSAAMQSPPTVNEPYAAAARFRPIPKASPVAPPAVAASATITNLSAQKETKPTILSPQTASPSSADQYAAARGLRPIPKTPVAAPPSPASASDATPPAHSEAKPTFLPPQTASPSSADPYAAARGLRPPTKVDLPKQNNDIR